MAEQQHERGTGRIVVGVDGSPSSRAALRWALDYARLSGKRVTAVSAWQYPHDYGFAVTPVEVWHPDTDAAEALEAAVRDVTADDRPDAFEAITRQGHPTKVLLDLGNEADLLVVGSRGHGGFTGLLLGSVSAACAEHARCPVLVMHRHPPRPKDGGRQGQSALRWKIPGRRATRAWAEPPAASSRAQAGTP